MFEMEAFHKRKAHLNIILFIATWQCPEEGERGTYGLFVHMKLAIMLTRTSILDAVEHVLKARKTTLTCETITSKIRPKLLLHRATGYTSAASANWRLLWANLQCTSCFFQVPDSYFLKICSCLSLLYLYITFFLWTHGIFQNICQILEITAI